MNQRLLTFGLVAALVACGGGGGGGGFDEILAKGKAFKDATCACTDSACIDQVAQDLAAGMAKAIKGFKGKPTKAQDEARAKLDDERGACEAKIKIAEADAAVGAALTRMKGFVAQACACADAACGTKVQTDVIVWLESEGRALRDLKASDAVMKQAAKVSEEMGLCLTKVMTPPPTPAAPPPMPPPPAP